MSHGYNIYGPARTPGLIDYTSVTGHTAAGVATIDLAGLALAEDVDWYFGIRAESAAGVEEDNTDQVVRVRISGGVLIGPPPNQIAWARPTPAAAGKMNLDLGYDAAGEDGEATSVQVVAETDGTINWAAAESFVVAGTTVRTVTLAASHSHGAAVRVHLRARTDAGATGPVYHCDPVAADAEGPEAPTYATASQA